MWKKWLAIAVLLVIPELAFAQGPPAPQGTSIIQGNVVLSVTNAGENSALPVATSVGSVALTYYNSGSKDAFCTPVATSGGAATTSSLKVPAGTYFTAYNVSLYSFVSCITGGSDTTSVTIYQGNGPNQFGMVGTSGSGVAGVSSFNTRTGGVTLQNSDVLAVSQPNGDPESTALGRNALANYTGTNGESTALGDGALEFDTTGVGATAVGRNACGGASAVSLTNAYDTCIGASAGAYLQGAGNQNVVLGDDAGEYGTTYTSDTLLGYQSGRSSIATPFTGSDDVAIGFESDYNLAGNVQFDTSVGDYTGYNMTGNQNALLGYTAGEFLSSGVGETFLGSQAGIGVTGSMLTGSNNVAVGYQSGFSFQGVANSNSCVGTTSCEFVSTATGNTALGQNALAGVSGTLTTGSFNTAVGYIAGQSIRGAGTENTCLGAAACGTVTTGNHNTMVGFEVGDSQTTSGTNNVMIGTNSNCDNASNLSNTFMVCAASGTTPLMSGSLASGSLALTINGTVTIPTPFTLGATSVTSTGTQINYLNAATGTTGTTSTNVVFSDSPALTGTPTAPTAAVNTNTTQLATTAFVIGQGYGTGTGNALFGTTTGNVNNDAVCMSNATVGVKDCGSALGTLAALSSINNSNWSGTGLALTNIATVATNTILANVTSGTAAPTAAAAPSCSTSASALNWTTNTGLGCNTSINAATLGGATFASPGAIGGTARGSALFTTLGANSTFTDAASDSFTSSGDTFNTTIALGGNISGGTNITASNNNGYELQGGSCTASATTVTFNSDRNTATAGIGCHGVTGDVNIVTGAGTESMYWTTASTFCPGCASASIAETGYVCYGASNEFFVDTALCVASLGKFKTISSPITGDDAIADIAALHPVWGKWNQKTHPTSDTHEQPFLIAEDVNAADPRLNTYFPDGTLHGVHYDELTAVLVAAVQKLNARLTKLENSR